MNVTYAAVARAGLLLISILLLVACSNSAHVPVSESRGSSGGGVASGGRYVVQPGDTLFGIAFRHDLDYRKLGAANGLTPPYRLFPGDVIQLREAAVAPLKAPSSPPVKTTTKAPVKPVASPPVAPPPQQKITKNADIVHSQPTAKKVEIEPVKTKQNTQDSQWVWPVQGKIERYFSADGLSKGLDIAGAVGTPIRSARAGQVIYAGSRLKGYGQLIIIRHDDTYLSAYAHNRVILVKEGQAVRQGDVIAELGMTGTQSPKLHFEIRRAGKPVNPLDLLPKQ